MRVLHKQRGSRELYDSGAGGHSCGVCAPLTHRGSPGPALRLSAWLAGSGLLQCPPLAVDSSPPSSVLSSASFPGPSSPLVTAQGLSPALYLLPLPESQEQCLLVSGCSVPETTQTSFPAFKTMMEEGSIPEDWPGPYCGLLAETTTMKVTDKDRDKCHGEEWGSALLDLMCQMN